MNQQILIVEDDSTFGLMLQSWLKKNSFATVWCQNISNAKKELLQNSYNLILSDLRLPDGDGVMLLAWLREQKISTPIIIMTSYGDIHSAVASIKLGAEDYLEKPVNPSILKDKIELALKKRSAQKESGGSGDTSKKMVLGRSPEAVQMHKYIKMVAPTMMSVLILGESGTGKEFVARTIHEGSKRKGAPFIAVDCGSLSKELAPSELFGHLKGSFTSSIQDKKGVFEQAKGGTVFLDEVGNLSYEVQVQLLRALQEKMVRPVGSAKDIRIDVRIISATNENLLNAISKGRFREDLYHRLNEFSLSVPPLRKQPEDIELFALHFMEEANIELDKRVSGFSRSTMKIFEEYHWSGNLRELRNVVRRAVLFCTGSTISPDNLPIMQEKQEEEEDLALMPDNEQQQIAAALKKARGNKSLAAKLLKIDRKTLYNKLHLYGMI